MDDLGTAPSPGLVSAKEALGTEDSGWGGAVEGWGEGATQTGRWPAVYT